MTKTKETDLVSIKDLGKAFGSLGGRATSKKYGKDHFRKLASLRWSKKRDTLSPKTRDNQ